MKRFIKEWNHPTFGKGWFQDDVKYWLVLKNIENNPMLQETFILMSNFLKESSQPNTTTPKE